MKLNQNGGINGLLVPLILVIVFFIASLTFGLWSFSGRQKYKNDTDQLIASAVYSAQQQQQTTDNHKFALAEENPLITYDGPEAYGSLVVNYPRTWSSYVDTTGGGYPVDGYFYPGTLPSVIDANGTPNFALRIQVENSSYSDILQEYTSAQDAGNVTVTPYSLPKVPSVVGVKIVGQLIGNGKSGTLVILPLRSEALEIWTDGTQYLTDFNNNILPNFSFSP